MCPVNKSKNNHPKRAAGYSLIELVIGLSLITIMMPSTMVVYQQVLQSKWIAESRLQAANLGLEVLDHTVRLPFSEVRSANLSTFNRDNGDGCVTDGGNDGDYDEEEAGEDSPYCDPNYANYSYQIIVTDADPNDLDCVGGALGCNTDPDYQKVRIEVTSVPAAFGSVVLETLVTNNQ